MNKEFVWNEKLAVEFALLCGADPNRLPDQLHLFKNCWLTFTKNKTQKQLKEWLGS